MSTGIQPYTPGGDASAAFQNTIDWGLVGTSTVAVTFDILARYCAAKVDHFTTAIGEALCKHWFELSTTGSRNITDALAALPCNGTFGDLLWMGFGRRHLVRALSGSAQGTVCLALCSALSECFHEEVAGEILYEMVKTVNAPSHLTPSIIQWKALIHACSGALALSDFSSLVEELIQLNPSYWSLDIDAESYEKAKRNKCPSPKSVAEALQSIGDISKGKLSAVTIIGSNAIGWLAAIAEWMFSLSVSLQATDGTVIYRNMPNKHIQIHFIFKDTSLDYLEEDTSYQVQCVGKVHVLNDASSLLQLQRSADFLSTCGGRLPWENIFNRFFGSTFAALVLNERLAFATAIGNAARILHAIVHAESAISRELIAKWRSYATASYGKGFIEFITWRFPELTQLRSTIDVGYKATLEEASLSYENQITKLKITCAARGCAICKGTASAYASSEQFCQVTMVETILALALALAPTQVVNELFIKAAGLGTFYEWQVIEHRKCWQSVEEGSSQPSPQFTVLDSVFSGIFGWSVRPTFGTRWNSLYGVHMELFSVSRCSELEQIQGATAIAASGICIYSGILTRDNLASFDLEEASRIFVCVGNIEHDGKPFEMISDDISGSSNRTRLQYGEEIPMKMYEPGCKLQGQVRETAHGLRVCYHIVPQNALYHEGITIWPGSLAEKIGFSRGWIHCKKIECQEVLEVNGALKNRDFGSIKSFGMEFHIAPKPPLAKCGTMAVAIFFDTMTTRTLLRETACLQCCIRTALSGDTETHYRVKHADVQPEVIWTIV